MSFGNRLWRSFKEGFEAGTRIGLEMDRFYTKILALKLSVLVTRILQCGSLVFRSSQPRGYLDKFDWV